MHTHLKFFPQLLAALLTAATIQGNAQVAPQIVTAPTDQIVSAGATATFSVTATGTAPLAYQWAKNGVNIAGATNATHSVTNAQLTDVAEYTVWVSNASGSDVNFGVLLILPTGSFNGSDGFSTARNTALWGVNDIALAGSALTESGGKLVLTGTTNAASYSQVSALRVWQSGLAPFASDWAAEAEVTVPNAVFTGANQKAKWKLGVVNTADLTDFLDLRLQSTAANGQFVRSETEVNGLDGPSLTSAVGVGETVRLRMTWVASTKEMRLAWFAGGVSNYLGSHNLGPGSQTEFTNCTGFVLSLSGETEFVNPMGLLVADNFTTTPSTAALAPIITSATTFSAPVGQSFSYQITAHNTPTSYNATGLPAGLTVNTGTGLISGTPTAAGTPAITLSASNAGGTGTQTLTLTLTPSIPAISSPTTATATVGQAFSYQITANNTPTSFSASGLPAGLSVNAATGLISGTPTTVGSSTVTLSAGNAGGVGTQVLTVVVNPPAPVITSSANAAASVGQSFTYQIVANNIPTSFGATGLPAGLSVSTGTGQISGTPTGAGTFTVTLSATNPGGTGTLTLTLGVNATPPVAAAISAAPIDQLVSAGSAATFSVTATGTAPLAYQWSKNGVIISGAVNSTYTVSNAQLADAARYSVVVSNAGGAETEAAFLGIRPTGAFAGSDAFSGARNQSLWGANDAATAGSALSESGGKLSLTGTANAANDNEVFAVRAWQSGLAPFASDWAVEVDVTLPNAVFTGSAGATSAKWELNAYNAGDLRDKLELHFEAFASAGTVTSRFVRARVDVDGNEALPGNAVQSASLSLGESVRLRLVWSAATQSLSVAYVDGGVTNVLGSFALGSGTFLFANCTGFLITLSGETGNTSPVATMVADNFTTTQPAPAVAPVISSAATATATVGQSFSYQITANNVPTSFSATGLPAGLVINTASGLISGTPTTAGTSTITISASNAGGTGTQTLTVVANPPAPLITSAATATAMVGQAFSYTITANNSPTAFNATGLPTGLSVNTGTGLISGTPTAAGTSTVTLSASNGGGTGNQTLTLTVSSAPVVGTNQPSNLNVARYHHTATLLPNGKVLVTGGFGLFIAELLDPGTGIWTMTNPMAFSRFVHTATLLNNGLVLVVGGYGGSGFVPGGGSYLSSAELYNPATGTWTPTGSLSGTRYAHTATLLPDGKVLVAGGENGAFLSSTEIYDPVAGTWTTTGSLNSPRVEFKATLLASGLVLVTGGRNTSGTLTSAEVFNPATGTWTAVGNLNARRAGHTATLLANGEVLVAGGFPAFSPQTYLTSAEKFNPVTGTWSITGSLTTARQYHASTLLPSGQVVVAGGNNPAAVASLELFNPANGTWTTTNSLQAGRYHFTATSLSDGRVLFAGGQPTGGGSLASAEIFAEPSPPATPPAVTVQPTAVTTNVGGNATFTVTATGTAPLSYQWLKEGVNLSGETAAMLSLSNVQTNQAGNYSVVITNVAGSVTSSVVVLTVNRLAQTITFGALPAKQLGDAPFALGASASSGLAVSYASSNPSVATVSGNTVTITGAGTTTITASQAGNATYLPASSVSQSLTVTGSAPVISAAPTGQSFTQGSALTLGVTVSGSAPLFYQWQFNGVNLPGANSPTLALSNLTATNAGAYRVVITNASGTATSPAADVYFYGDLKFIAATVLAGSVGQQYRVDYADVVTVGTTNWLVLTNVALPYSPFLVIDPNSAGRTQRYYRAVPLP